MWKMNLKHFTVENNHPLFVNPRNGFIDMIKVLKYFPHMTQPYVSTIYWLVCF